jgi:hypothetical protein
MSTPPHRPQPPKPRMTWVDASKRYWRVEPVAGRWQLSLYSPATETWTRIGSYPSKTAAIEAAYEQN